MLKTLPFNALRTLESVVRLRGFGRAAEELNVTQSAVSQHIKLLEDWLGHRLLIRRSRKTVPTEAGERLAQATREGFGGIEMICDELRGSKRTRGQGILVGAPPGFAFVWLLPRLLRFDHMNPDISISLSTDPHSREPSTGEADVFISYSAGGFPGLHAEQLMDERMSPVCAPNLARTVNAIGDLSNHTILRDNLESDEALSPWEFWAKECGIGLPHFNRTKTYGQANLVVQAAVQGLGIAMGRGPLVADAIKDGTLVRPFEATAPSQFSYWFVCRHEALKSDNVNAFRKWLHEEAKPFRQSGNVD
ncbi:LysR substrate-binding domain-containing protein [uncultured Roseobacter sp.]|uniref:LysR substrate-binding domain-containing protein n=1 Tax=uncultured Roseobacter sp. TaxID=114847 RepID=UPI00260AA50C|nr:LysR substrate-binding domain-containing protein [uncultured Roseobacter sp.]